MVSLNAIQKFGIAERVPLGGVMSYADVAKSIGVNEQITRRLLRHAMTMHVFQEPEPGMVAHTSVSKMLHQPGMRQWMASGCEEMWPAALRTVDAISKYPDSQEPNHTGFSLANNTEHSIYQVVAADPVRAQRFAEAMAAFISGRGYDTSDILENYDWDTLGKVTVVDVGGAQGHVGIDLAQRFPNLKVVVQDMEFVVKDASSRVPDEMQSRVRYMAHDFFSDQTVDASVYYFRWIFHNWSDKYSLKILRALIPALKPGAKILIHDYCLPDKPGDMALWREKQLRSMDLDMLAILNARERDTEEWKALLQEADPRFKFVSVKRPKNYNLAIIDFHWEPNT
ncbi:hypothetical protein MMC25_007613 [Agyrium rufum]|nr:hypothetical protein [Agyrium rufum]